MKWLGDNHPDVLAWYVDDPRPTFVGTTNSAFYVSCIRDLQQYVTEEEFIAIVGVRFSKWLEDNE